jgi:hypothetical protein
MSWSSMALLQATPNAPPPSMNTSTSSREPQRAGEIGNRAPKANKACMPCRARKVKCDAAVVGLPCSTCTSRQCAKECVQLVRKGRTR